MMDAETDFLCSLLELQYGQKVEEKLQHLAAHVPWAQGWPARKESFWNAEAFMWQHKIEKEKRQLIQNELLFLHNGKNLDLGCGSYSYLPSVGFDLSEKMLEFNDSCALKIQGNVEEPLPFIDNEFDSITAVFILNYIQNYSALFQEIKRITKTYFVMILSSQKINEWQRQKEVYDFTADRWCSLLREAGFGVEFYEKESLWFFVCRKEER